MRLAPPLVLLLSLATASVGLAEPTVLIEDPARPVAGDDARLVTSETLAYRAYRELLERVPVPDNPAIGGTAMVGLSTMSAARVKRGGLSEEVQERLEGWDGFGAAISRVLPNSPAEAAWLQAGDVVVRLGSIWIDRDDTLTWVASRTEPLKETELWYWREGQVYRTWIVPGLRDVVQAKGDGRDRPIEGYIFKIDQEGLVPPRLIEEVEVDYPSPARRAQAGGRAVFRVVVADDGSVRRVDQRTSTGREDLDEAAIEALEQRSYEPGRFRGRNVQVGLDVVVVFWPDGPPEIEDESGAAGNG